MAAELRCTASYITPLLRTGPAPNPFAPLRSDVGRGGGKAAPEKAPMKKGNKFTKPRRKARRWDLAHFSVFDELIDFLSQDSLCWDLPRTSSRVLSFC